MNRLVVLDGSLRQVKVEPFNYRYSKTLAEGWSVADQLCWGEHLVILLERADLRASQDGAAGSFKFPGP